eukprot:3167972-Pleurochrysis_carterae.AAC.5
MQPLVTKALRQLVHPAKNFRARPIRRAHNWCHKVGSVLYPTSATLLRSSTLDLPYRCQPLPATMLHPHPPPILDVVPLSTLMVGSAVALAPVPGVRRPPSPPPSP